MAGGAPGAETAGDASFVVVFGEGKRIGERQYQGGDEFFLD